MVYAKNADLRREIHLSKSSYCEFEDIKFRDYDLIVTRRDDARVGEARVELGREPIVRLLTREHLPAHATNLNFNPFVHLVDGVIVGRSHWRNGAFSADHGALTRPLATMIALIASGMARRSNWAGYTYVDEMRSEALIQMLANVLKFEESKSDNPFAYCSMIAHNTFLRVHRAERKHHLIRDELLVAAGATPSFGYQDRAK